MCLSVPGKIVKIEKDKAIVDYEVEQRTATLISKGFKVGEYVIVQGGMVIEKIPENEAKQALETYIEAMS